MSLAEVLSFVAELVGIIAKSPDPRAAMQRARVAAETEALNVAADEALRRLP